MPLDSRKASLRTLVEIAGLTPIDDETLKAHCAAEIARHPAGWFHRHTDLVHRIQIGIFLSAIAIAAVGSPTLVLEHQILIAGVTLAICGVVVMMLFMSDNITTRGPAFWSESIISYNDLCTRAPAEIILRAQQVMEEDRTIHLTIGELRQERVLLDPYLLVTRKRSIGKPEVVCIGIWDGDRIIA